MSVGGLTSSLPPAEIPQAAIFTKVDLCSPEIKKDLTAVYQDCKLKKKVSLRGPDGGAAAETRWLVHLPVAPPTGELAGVSGDHFLLCVCLADGAVQCGCGPPDELRLPREELPRRERHQTQCGLAGPGRPEKHPQLWTGLPSVQQQQQPRDWKA